MKRYFIVFFVATNVTKDGALATTNVSVMKSDSQYIVRDADSEAIVKSYKDNLGVILADLVITNIIELNENDYNFWNGNNISLNLSLN